MTDRELLAELRRVWLRMNWDGEIHRLGSAVDVYNRALSLLDNPEACGAALAAPPPAGPRMFPIQGGPAIPWDVIAACERQAISNHDQTIERLAQRGGLDPGEAIDVLLGRRWSTTRRAGITGAAAINKMLSIVQERLAFARPDAGLVALVREWREAKRVYGDHVKRAQQSVYYPVGIQDELLSLSYQRFRDAEEELLSYPLPAPPQEPT